MKIIFKINKISLFLTANLAIAPVFTSCTRLNNTHNVTQEELENLKKEYYAY